MKIILCCVLMVACTYLGFVVANNLKQKRKFWEDMVRFCEFLASNIGFGQRKIDEIVSEYKDICSCDCQRLLTTYIDGKSGVDLLYDMQENFFEREEEKLLQEFFSVLGELDVYNELVKIENYKARFSKKFDYYLEKNNKYAPLTVKLSIIFGIVVCIVFF